MAEQKRRGRPPGSKNKTTGSAGKKSPAKKETGSRLRDEIWAIVILAVGAFLIIAFHFEVAGALGNAIAKGLKGLFGGAAYVLPYYLIVYGILLFAKKTAHIGGRSVTFLFIIFLMISILISSPFLGAEDASYSFSSKFIGEMFHQGIAGESGGVFGMTMGLLLMKIIGMPGLYIFSVVMLFISLLLVINTPVSQFLDKLKEKRQARREQEALEEEMEGVVIADGSEVAAVEVPVNKKSKKKEKKDNKTDLVESKESPVRETEGLPERPPLGFTGMSHGQMKILDYMKAEDLFDKGSEEHGTSGFGLEEASKAGQGLGLDGTPAKEVGSVEKAEVRDKKEEAMLKPEELNLAPSATPVAYKLPSVDLLNKKSGGANPNESQSLQAKAMKLEQTLQDFNVNAKVVQVTKGPAVTRYEIQPNTGVKVSSIVRLADDIALNLEAKSIRIEAPIPGKAAVGIEVENDRVNLVSLREIIESGEFKNGKSKLSFAVGKDIAGKSIVADLKSMPHMLIAGSTGSGKSVCINSIIISMLYKAKPDEVKFVLIDPKVVELGNYNGIPHLLIPVVTDPSKAAAALNWAVAEMTDRYKKFAEEGVRDLESFNNTVKSKGEADRFLPQIVIIIDELADLMMAAPSQVEESICRLAQMARAAGMHLIVATQRPSVDIITGVIKANIPSRIAFAVSSQFDSRTILDMGGAEKLVGKGDMLFNPIGMSKPIRVQGTFISDGEVHKVIEFVKGQTPEATYADDVLHSIEKVQTASGAEEEDELLADAIETVVRAEQASVSMLQRRFRIGYNRAARLIDMMEARGIISAADGSRPRKVFLTEEELLNMNEKLEEV